MQRSRWWKGLKVILLLAGSALCLSASAAENLKEAKTAFLDGRYARCVTLAEAALENYGDKEEWQLVLLDALMAQGKYPEALEVTTNALPRNPWSIRLRWRAREVFLQNGQTDAAASMVDSIVETVSAQPRAFREPEALVVFAQAALLKGADPKRVLDTVLETARKAEPTLREVYLAAGQIALEKHDYALAAKKFEAGLKVLPGDPDLHFGIAQAYAPSDPELTRAALTTVLERNSNHVGCLLLLVDRSIDAEDFEQADELLDQIQSVNRAHPDAWAYRAVLAHFRNRKAEVKAARAAALKYWPTNPRVDYLIGQKLSQHYRFEAGVDYQRQALTFDPNFLPARAQLAQDLLRLGEEVEGWMLADRVHREDGYNIEAYNLTTLHDSLQKFVAVTNADFLVRMDPHEAAVYGDRVLELLEEVRGKLSAKYGIEPRRPTLVEIFPQQKDFAVRTFGMPGNPGYLGVCFGTVITANSPAAHSGREVNWEAVLWHEFTHVITLQMTQNKMPRWLSEGISVYEELQANPAWGQRMEPSYREMILEGGMTPVSKLSGVFLSPDTDLHLQFAYFQSALVVEFLIERFGLEKLKAVLAALADGTEVNTAIQRHTLPMNKIDSLFEKYARDKALAMAPGLDWSKPESNPFTQAVAGARPRNSERRRPTIEDAFPEPELDWEEWARSRPTNYWVMARKAGELIQAEAWREAKPILETLVSLYPGDTGRDSAYRMLALVHRELGDTNAEIKVLTSLSEKDDTAVDAYMRLMELCGGLGQWDMVRLNAKRYLAVNPLVSMPYRWLASAAEELQDWPTAIRARRTLLLLDPVDPADAHFRLAQLLHRVGDPGAKKHVLKALEEAPRFRAALQLLLELERRSQPESSSTTLNQQPIAKR